MRSHGSLVPCALCVVVCIVAATAYSQQVTTSTEVNSTIAALRDAPVYERGQKRALVVGLGSLAVDPVMAVVQNREATKDASFITNCVMALGELRDAKASPLLIEVLGERNIPLASVAAKSLGQIWEGRGPRAPEVKPVNAALLALLHSQLPDVGVYMPALALIKVNKIPLDRPEGMPADQLRASVSEWFTRNQDALPSPTQRPWQLNVYVALNDSDGAARQAAVSALQQQRELGCIDPILTAISGQASVAPELVKLVSDLSGVAFPPAGMPADSDAKAQVDQWRWLWLGELAEQTDQRHVDYSLSGFEGALCRYEDAPSDETAAPVKFFRMALLNQLAGAGDIPGSLSAKATSLIEDPLTRKEVIAGAVAELEKATGPFEKNTQLRLIGNQVRETPGREVAVQFLSRLHDLAYAEENASVAGDIGDVLALVSGLPCALRPNDIETRRARLAKWLTEAQDLNLATDAKVQ